MSGKAMLEMEDTDYKCCLDKETLEKATRDLGENDETRIVEVRKLRRRLQELPDLKPRLDINFLLRFLRVRKFDQDKAFESVKAFYGMKRNFPEIFNDLKPSTVKEVMDTNYIEILKNRDKEGRRVMIIREAQWGVEKNSGLEPMKLYAICLLMLQEEEQNQIHGIHFVIDLAGMTWRHMEMTPPYMVNLRVDMPMVMVPLQLKRIDYVHQPEFFNDIFHIFKQNMDAELVDKLYMNNIKYEDLHSSIDPDYLPTDYGGKLEPFSYKDWKITLLDSEKAIEEENKFGYDVTRKGK